MENEFDGSVTLGVLIEAFEHFEKRGDDMSNIVTVYFQRNNQDHLVYPISGVVLIDETLGLLVHSPPVEITASDFLIELQKHENNGCSINTPTIMVIMHEGDSNVLLSTWGEIATNEKYFALRCNYADEKMEEGVIKKLFPEE